SSVRSSFLCTTLFSCLFLLTHTSTPEIYPLSLHDALPISAQTTLEPDAIAASKDLPNFLPPPPSRPFANWPSPATPRTSPVSPRSEEHTSELQSRRDLVCRLLLEKKKKLNKIDNQSEQDLQ